jgi:tRNA threonylcarbamoyladenosine biosynthesis protein TsaB
MLVLALDTTTRLGSAALNRDGVLLGTYIGDATVTHGVRLPGDLLRLVSAHGVHVADVDLFAVAAGPGSFTGLRVGIATQQGLAFANNRPLIGVSALDALNHAVRSLILHPSPLTSEGGEREMVVWMDAQRGEVFSAVYVSDRALEGPTVEKPDQILGRRAAARQRGGGPAPAFAGDGAVAYRSLIRDFFPDAHIVTDLPLLAPSIACLAEELLRTRGPVAPDAIRPIYIRRSDAELARERMKV